MIRTLLFASFAAVAVGASAQCVPNALYADSVFGVWPDTTENFVPGTVGVFYSDTMNVLVPTDAGLVDSDFSGFTIDSVSMDQLTGLPPGLGVSCNSQTASPCTYLASQLGCGLIEGTPTEIGTFPIVIEVTVYAQFFGTQAIPYSFSGYSITIGADNVGIHEDAAVKLDRVRNQPNPFSDHTLIEFGLSKAATAKVKVFNLVGGELWSTSVQGKAGQNRVRFDANGLESGMYIYRVEADGATWTGRMMVNR